jgi:hypothetical protein
LVSRGVIQATMVKIRGSWVMRCDSAWKSIMVRKSPDEEAFVVDTGLYCCNKDNLAKSSNRFLSNKEPGNFVGFFVLMLCFPMKKQTKNLF